MSLGSLFENNSASWILRLTETISMMLSSTWLAFPLQLLSMVIINPVCVLRGSFYAYLETDCIWYYISYVAIYRSSDMYYHLSYIVCFIFNYQIPLKFPWLSSSIHVVLALSISKMHSVDLHFLLPSWDWKWSQSLPITPYTCQCNIRSTFSKKDINASHYLQNNHHRRWHDYFRKFFSHLYLVFNLHLHHHSISSYFEPEYYWGGQYHYNSIWKLSIHCNALIRW